MSRLLRKKNVVCWWGWSKGGVGFIIELWYFIFQHRSTLQDFFEPLASPDIPAQHTLTRLLLHILCQATRTFLPAPPTPPPLKAVFQFTASSKKKADTPY